VRGSSIVIIQCFRYRFSIVNNSRFYVDGAWLAHSFCHFVAFSCFFSFELECASSLLAQCVWVRVLTQGLSFGAKRCAIHWSDEASRVGHISSMM
jgi:hypothetical protein